MAGALGTFATGLGTTDILAVLQTGRTWLRMPETDRIDFTGCMAPHLRGKDIALWMMSTYGEGGAGWKCLEFHDRTEDDGIPMDGRLTLANMAVDCGAMNGIWVPDDVTLQYYESNGGKWPENMDLEPDCDADYADHHSLDVGGLSPQIAVPYSPANVVDIERVCGEKVHQVFIGSCAGGRIEEIRDAAMLLKGQRVSPFLKLVVTPASQHVYKTAMDEGLLSTLMDAGAVITNPSCGACGGIDKGLVAASEVCISTSNRNFRGRMGDVDAQVYLASGLTAAAAALTGRVTDPREVMA
jgi:3-isopropylmalate/(R)-2-methylmalate dehydratase large subunit